MKWNAWIIALVTVPMLLSGCGKEKLPDEYKQLDEETRAQRKYVNTFAWNVLDAYYLWRDEIATALDQWQNWEEPILKVKEVRYKDASGKDIDRWTQLTDDFESFRGVVSGHTRTFGMDYQLYYADDTQTRIVGVVTFTYAGSPAEAAGLVRGDYILTLDGREMTPDNYQQLLQETLWSGGTVQLGLSGNRSVSITAVDMYENPIQTVSVLERPDGRKVGYLHYTSFTLDSCDELTRVFRNFKAEGIDDLVLDLRYNGGGYLQTEKVLASMLAPVAVVNGDNVFFQEIYGSNMPKDMREEPARFETGFLFRNNGALQIVSTAGANPDLPRLYVLVTRTSASASESLICSLCPYMDIVLIGEKTAGKYCAGYLIGASAWYESARKSLGESEYGKALSYVDNWGIYVMYSRYADCNGVTRSMPDGIAPDVEAKDRPQDGFTLGDPEEPMLAAALALMEGRPVPAGTRAAPASCPDLTPVPGGYCPRATGLLIGRF